MNSSRLRFRIGAALACAALGGILAAHGDTYYVDVNYDGTNGASDGTETKPWTKLGDAVPAFTASSGHTVKVAGGLYKSTADGGLETFGTSGYNLNPGSVNNRVGAWRGGYVGQVSGATFDWSEETRVFPTADVDTTGMTVIDLTGANSRAFYASSYEHTLTFDGLRFQNSDVSQSAYHGGALYNNGGMDPSVMHNCAFVNNQTTGEGGGAWFSGRDGVSTNCIFAGNAAENGGGASIRPGNGTHTIRGFVFTDNTATLSGGGLYVPSYAVDVEQCLFEGNVANGSGDNGGGGVSSASSIIRRTRFFGNSAPNGWGGAVGRKRWETVTLTLESCLLVGNSAANFTVAAVTGYNGASLYLRHVTMVDNTGGGAIADNGNSGFHATLTVLNSILMNNGAKGIQYTDSGTLNVDYNDVLGHTTDYDGLTAGANDLSVDPDFVDASNGDYRLLAESPCVDAGADAGVTSDLDGVGRPTRYGYDIGCFEEKDLPMVAYLYPMSQSTEATPRVALSYVPDGYPTDAWLVFDTEDKGTGDVLDWGQRIEFVEPAEGVAFGYTFTGLNPDTEYCYRVWTTNDYGAVWSPLGTVRTLASGAPIQLLWLPSSANLYWSTAAAETNWSANAGATRTAWVQGASAVFDGIPASTPRVQGGGVEFNSIRLTGVSSGTLTINRLSGNDTDHLVAVGAARVDAPAGATISLPQVRGSVGLTVGGGGLATSSRGFTFSGGVRVLDGTFQALPSDTNGDVELLAADGVADARLYIRGVNSNWTVNSNVVARGGSTGLATIENSPTSGTRYFPTLGGELIVTNKLRITTSGKPSYYTLAGTVSGPGDLELAVAQNTDGFVLTGDSSAHTGNLTLLNANNRTSVTNELNGVQGHCRIAVGANFYVTGTGTLICNVADGTADKVTLGSNASMTLTGLTLQPSAAGEAPGEYPIITPHTRVVGEFASVVGPYTVDYDGTATYPDDVVLVISPPAGTVMLVR